MAGYAGIDEFKYFSYLIIVVLLMYVAILCIFLVFRRNQIRADRDNGVLQYQDAINEQYCADYRINLTTKFEQIIQCSLGVSSTYRITLMCVRLILFLYFFVVGGILNGIERSGAFYYFENWCALLVMFYFLLSTVCSIIAIHTERSRSEVDRRLNVVSAWTLKVRILGVCTHLVFEVAGGTSLFVLVMVNFVHGPSSEIINAVHYMTFFALLLEMWLNTVRVRLDQYPACAAWLVFYLLVIWPCVFTGIIPTWPYSQMSTLRTTCFLNYFVLFLLNFLFYAIWYILYKLKKLSFVCKERYVDGQSVGDDQSQSGSVANSGYSGSWFDSGDDWRYPVAAVASAAPSSSTSVNRTLNLQPMGAYHGGSNASRDGGGIQDRDGSSTYYDERRPPAHSNHVNRSLNLQPMGAYHGGSNASRDEGGYAASSTNGSSTYYDERRPPAHSNHVNRSLNLQPMGAYRQNSTNSYENNSVSDDGFNQEYARSTSNNSFNYWNSGAPVRPPVTHANSHNRTLNLNPISTYHQNRSSSLNSSNSDTGFAFYGGDYGAGAGGAGVADGYSEPYPEATQQYHPSPARVDYPPPAPTMMPVQRTNTAAVSHNRGVNINPLNTYHRNGGAAAGSTTFAEPPPPAPQSAAAPAASSTWRGYAIGGSGNRATNNNNNNNSNNNSSNAGGTSSASSGIRFPAYSNKPATTRVDRSLNLNPINRYHQTNQTPNNTSRQFSNTDNDLENFAEFEEGNEYA